MMKARERKGLTSLLIGALMLGLGAFGAVKERPLDKRIINSHYEIAGRDYGENWKYYIGLEGLGTLVMIGGYYYLKKR